MGLFDWFFAFCAKKAFQQVDTNHNGKLDVNEVEIAVLHVVNVVNKRLPGWQDPPPTDAIKKAVETFGKGLGFLDEDTFVDFSRSLVKNGPDIFFKRVGGNAILKTGILPGITHLVKKRSTRGDPVVRSNKERERNLHAGDALHISGVPNVILSPAIGALSGVVRGLLPIG